VPFLDVLDGNPDLYGPFWIATTVVFILFLAGSINARWGRAADGEGGFDWGLLSGSAGLVYGYTGVIPVVLWSVLWGRSESANLAEFWCLYGYANLIWIPVAIISWSWIDGTFTLLWFTKTN
jgi:protein YIPF1/2